MLAEVGTVARARAAHGWVDVASVELLPSLESFAEAVVGKIAFKVGDRLRREFLLQLLEEA